MTKIIARLTIENCMLVYVLPFPYFAKLYGASAKLVSAWLIYIDFYHNFSLVLKVSIQEHKCNGGRKTTGQHLNPALAFIYDDVNA